MPGEFPLIVQYMPTDDCGLSVYSLIFSSMDEHNIKPS